MQPADPHAVVDRLFREEQGRAVATLIRVLGDFDLAEEAVQEAFVTALEVCRRDPPQVVLTDLAMGPPTGRDLVTALPPQRASDVLSTGVGPDDRP